jgi:hypothetical protein
MGRWIFYTSVRLRLHYYPSHGPLLTNMDQAPTDYVGGHL